MLRTICERVGLPHSCASSEFEGRKLVCRVPIGLGATEDWFGEDEEITYVEAALEPSQVLLMGMPPVVTDFALQATVYGYRKAGLTFRILLVTPKGGLEHHDYGIRAHAIHNAEDVAHMWRDAKATVASTFGPMYRTLLLGIESVRVTVFKTNVRRGGTNVDLTWPATLKRSLFCIPKNEDAQCLRYAILLHFIYAFCKKMTDAQKRQYGWLWRHKTRPSVIERFHREVDYRTPKLDFRCLEPLFEAGDGVCAEAHTAQLTRFENINKVTLCVWRMHNRLDSAGNLTDEMCALRARRCTTPYEEITLLMVRNDGQPVPYHYVLCINPAGLVLDKATLDMDHNTYGCGRCGQVFGSFARVDAHKAACRLQRPKETATFCDPERKLLHDPHAPNNVCKAKLMAPVVVYADFEAIQCAVDTPNVLFTQRPCGFAFYVETTFAYSGQRYYEHWDAEDLLLQDAAHVFLTWLLKVYKQLKPAFFRASKAAWRPTEEERERFAEDSEGSCPECGVAFDSGNAPCMHHDHFTNRYECALCNGCNLAIREQPFHMRVFMHNMNYDLAGVAHALGSFEFEGDDDYDGPFYTIECVGAKMNTLKSLSILLRKPGRTPSGHKFRAYEIITFLDSMNHVSASLADIVSTVSDADLVTTKAALQQMGLDPTEEVVTSDGQAHKLWLGKSVFPYEWFRSVAQLQGPLPTHADFANTTDAPGVDRTALLELHDERVRRAGWTTFQQMATFYLHIGDICSYRDFFEAHRRRCKESYGLDPAQFITMPAYAWAAMLRMPISEDYDRPRLSYIHDQDMLFWMEDAKRGGISMAMHPHAKSNMPADPDFDPQLPRKQILYIDARNLYGWAMRCSLPEDDLTICTPRSLDEWMQTNDAIDYEGGEGTGYFFEVDLAYPSHLHALHSEYPLAPEKRAVQWEELSTDTQAVWKAEHPNEKYVPHEKLLTTLYDKSNYKLWGGALKFYVAQGLVVTTVHRVYSVRMRPWMRSYIDFNTRKRAEAQTTGDAVGKNMFKLMNNAVFGKTMEDKRDRKAFTVLRNFDGNEADSERLVTLASSPLFEKCVFGEGARLQVYQSARQVTRFDKPIYVGCAVLDMSKVLMYRAWYEHLLPQYGKRMQLLFTDTDSLCFSLEGGTWYEDVRAQPRLQAIMDTDKYGFPGTNNGALGMMEDECAPRRCVEVFAFRAKMHAQLRSLHPFWEESAAEVELDKKHTACKGVPARVVPKLQMWRQCLAGEQLQPVEFYEMRQVPTKRRRDDGLPIAQYSTDAPYHSLGDELGNETLRYQVRKAQKRTLSIFNDKIHTPGIPYGCEVAN